MRSTTWELSIPLTAQAHRRTNHTRESTWRKNYGDTRTATSRQREVSAQQAQEEAPSKFVGQNKDYHVTTPPWHEHKLSCTQSVHAAGEKRGKKRAPSAKQEFSSSATPHSINGGPSCKHVYRSSAAFFFFFFFAA